MTRFEQLRYAVSVLASSAEEQMRYLAGIGHFDEYDGVVRIKQISDISNVDELCNIDELALQFEDIACARNGMVEAREISEAQRDCIDQLDQVLESYSGQENAEFWTVKAVRFDPGWDIIRQKAKECLGLFPELQGL